jgi:Uma2 family endonuclease
MAVISPRVSEAEFAHTESNGRKLELVDGEVRELPSGFLHDKVVIFLARLLGPYADEYGEIVGSQAGFRMLGGNIRCLDLSVTSYDRIPAGGPPTGFFDGAPDLAIEVISPSETGSEQLRKRIEYFAAGSKCVWELDPITRSLAVYSSPDTHELLTSDSTVDGGEFLPGFSSKVDALFPVERS